MRYGKGEVGLGEMPILPAPEDQVRFVPPFDQMDDETVCLTVAHRIFEIRAFPGELRPAMQDGSPRIWRSEWVCLLTHQEVR